MATRRNVRVLNGTVPQSRSAGYQYIFPPGYVSKWSAQALYHLSRWIVDAQSLTCRLIAAAKPAASATIYRKYSSSAAAAWSSGTRRNLCHGLKSAKHQYNWPSWRTCQIIRRWDFTARMLDIRCQAIHSSVIAIARSRATIRAYGESAHATTRFSARFVSRTPHSTIFWEQTVSRTKAASCHWSSPRNPMLTGWPGLVPASIWSAVPSTPQWTTPRELDVDKDSSSKLILMTEVPIRSIHLSVIFFDDQILPLFLAISPP